MEKGPLVYSAAVLAAFLMVISFLFVAFPDDIEVLAAVGGVAVILVIAVLVLMLLKIRRGGL